MANSYLYLIDPANMTVAGVTSQAAAHGSLTFTQNRFFAAIGESVELWRNLEILDSIEWLSERCAADNDTARFPRPVAAGYSAKYGDVIQTSLAMKYNDILLTGATIVDPVSTDLNAVYWGLTGSAGAGLNQAVSLGSGGHESAFDVFKSFILKGENSPFT